MDDHDLARIDGELLRLRDRYHSLVKTVGAIRYRVDELEQWRQTDKPVIDGLVSDRIASTVRTAYAAERSKREWALWQKALAALLALPAFAASIVGLVAELHHLFS